ncbi:hypothetical protein L3067_01330 [Xanthomonas sp. PPL568]|uniref:hypothetical protein n=1 Tax=Xanthomonas indica TaxID=2912242 RepID=UPI001F590F97|nr:hypothetical protein [Xanthomonas indica]MCI2243251.1 hypothetical protein [Xanthomonas indica]
MFKSLMKAARRLLAVAGGCPSPEEFERFKQACVDARRNGYPDVVRAPMKLSQQQAAEIRAAAERAWSSREVPPRLSDEQLLQVRQVVVEEVAKVFAAPRDHAVRVKDFHPISAERIAEIRETFERGIHAGLFVPYKREGAE